MAIVSTTSYLPASSEPVSDILGPPAPNISLARLIYQCVGWTGKQMEIPQILRHPPQGLGELDCHMVVVEGRQGSGGFWRAELSSQEPL